MSDEPRRIARRALFGRLLPQAPEAGPWVKVHRTALACRFEVTLDSADARHVEAARAALDEVDAIEDALSWLRDTSEVSRLNRQAAKAPVPVSPGLFTLLSLCRELNAATGGAFDPASTALSRCWGFLERRPRLPPDEEIATARARSGMDKVTLDGMGRAVRFAVPGVELSFGAVGKGWALDRVAASMRVRGVGRALLTAGGSSHRGWGGESWDLALRPGGVDLGLLRLRDAALGTSAAGRAALRGGWPALRPRARPAHRLAGRRCPQRERRDFGGRGGRRPLHRLPRGRAVPRRPRSAPPGRGRWRFSSSTGSRERSSWWGSGTASRSNPRRVSGVVEAAA